MAISKEVEEIEENEVILPHHEQLQAAGIKVSDRALIKAVKGASDAYLSIQAWLDWKNKQLSIKSVQGSLLKALEQNWRPMEFKSDRRDAYVAPKPIDIPAMPKELAAWVLNNSSKVKSYFWSQVENQYIIEFISKDIIGKKHCPWHEAIRLRF